jgi:hypothetical protein
MKVINVIVAPNGQTRVETTGFQGAECQQASQFLEQALGAKSHEQLTAEFFQKQLSATPIREGQS